MNQKIRDIIINAVLELNERLDENERVAISEDPILFSKEKRLDSLSFVNLVVAIEEAIEEEFDKSISIVSEKAFSKSKSPFRKVSSMAEYIEELLKD